MCAAALRRRRRRLRAHATTACCRCTGGCSSKPIRSRSNGRWRRWASSTTSCGCRWCRCRRSIHETRPRRAARRGCLAMNLKVQRMRSSADRSRYWRASLCARRAVRALARRLRVADRRSARGSTTSRSAPPRRSKFRRTSSRRSTTTATTSRPRRGSPPRDATKPEAADQVARQRRRPTRGSCAPATSAGWSSRPRPSRPGTSTRQFWLDNGFVLAVEQPDSRRDGNRLGRESRRACRPTSCAARSASIVDVFYTTYKRDKFRTRIERGTEPGTVEIYISHRGMEQVPTTKIDNVVAGRRSRGR